MMLQEILSDVALYLEVPYSELTSLMLSLHTNACLNHGVTFVRREAYDAYYIALDNSRQMVKLQEYIATNGSRIQVAFAPDAKRFFIRDDGGLLSFIHINGEGA